jgi:hypothetical protein
MLIAMPLSASTPVKVLDWFSRRVLSWRVSIVPRSLEYEYRVCSFTRLNYADYSMNPL